MIPEISSGAGELLGLIVLDPETVRLLGTVIKVIVRPNDGVWLAILLQTPGGVTQAALRQHCQIFLQLPAVLVPQRYITDPQALAEQLAGGLAPVSLDTPTDFTPKGKERKQL